MLRATQHVVRTLAAIRFALSTRRDLLLEILALLHQLAVRARLNRRFRPSDCLLWLILRRVWPRYTSGGQIRGHRFFLMITAATACDITHSTEARA